MNQFLKPPRNPISTIFYWMFYISFLLSLYLIYDWITTNRSYKCQELIQTYGFHSYDNYSGILLSDHTDIMNSPNTGPIDAFRFRLKNVSWSKLQPQIKSFEQTMALLLEQLEGVNSKFIGPIGLRNSLEKEIEEYDLCRNKIKSQNRDLSSRYENLRNQQKQNQRVLDDLQHSKLTSIKKRDEVQTNLSRARNLISVKEKDLKKAEEELEVFQTNTNQLMNKLHAERQAKAKQQMEDLQNQQTRTDQAYLKIRNSYEFDSEELKRLKSKIQAQLAERDLLKRKLQRFQMNIDYDVQLKRLLPTEESIRKTRQLQKMFIQKYDINLAILKKMKGLPGEQQQRNEVKRLRQEVRKYKQALSNATRTLFSYKSNFEFQLSAIRKQLADVDTELDEGIKMKHDLEHKLENSKKQMESLDEQRKKISLRIQSKRNTGIPKNAAAQKQMSQQKGILILRISQLRNQLMDYENELRDLQNLHFSIEQDDHGKIAAYDNNWSDINRKIKETDTELNKLKRIMLSKLSECNSKKKFIQSIQSKGANQIEQAAKYYASIKDTKDRVKALLAGLYIE